MSDLEETLLWQIKAAGLVEPFREYRFAAHLGIGWRADFAWYAPRLLVEVEGGVHSGGRHVRGEGFEEDALKYACAILLSWRLLRFTGGQVESGLALSVIEEALGAGTAGLPALVATHAAARDAARARRARKRQAA